MPILASERSPAALAGVLGRLPRRRGGGPRRHRHRDPPRLRRGGARRPDSCRPGGDRRAPAPPRAWRLRSTVASLPCMPGRQARHLRRLRRRPSAGCSPAAHVGAARATPATVSGSTSRRCVRAHRSGFSTTCRSPASTKSRRGIVGHRLGRSSAVRSGRRASGTLSRVSRPRRGCACRHASRGRARQRPGRDRCSRARAASQHGAVPAEAGARGARPRPPPSGRRAAHPACRGGPPPGMTGVHSAQRSAGVDAPCEPCPATAAAKIHRSSTVPSRPPGCAHRSHRWPPSS